LNEIWGIEETKFGQRARERVIKEGGRNTRCFHVVANHRRRKILVHSIDLRLM
jgi:hypothetical protein